MGQIGFASGFAFQSSFGTWGNRELIIPWPAGGFAHFWYDYMWRGPALFGSGNVHTLAVWEGDYHSHDNDHGNFEMLAIVNGQAQHWFRENDHPLVWRASATLPFSDGAAGCALARTHYADRLDLDHEKLYALVIRPEGIVIYERSEESYQWSSFGPVIAGAFQGVGWALGTVEQPFTDFEDVTDSIPIFVYTAPDGDLGAQEHEHAWPSTDPITEPHQGGSVRRDWFRRATRIGRGARGRPCIIQTDRGHASGGYFILSARHGHYEAFVPSAAGGVLHFWRDNNSLQPTTSSWTAAPTIGHEVYDEVSAYQDSGERVGDETGRVHLFAWQRGQPWVHHFEQWHTSGGFQWHGPVTIGNRPSPSVMDPVPWVISCVVARSRGGRPRWVQLVGGVRNGQRWQMTKDQVMTEIRAGRKRFHTVSPDGRLAGVIVVDEIDPNRGVFHPYITTGSDGVPGNNLLNLPRCPP